MLVRSTTPADSPAVDGEITMFDLTAIGPVQDRHVYRATGQRWDFVAALRATLPPPTQDVLF